MPDEHDELHEFYEEEQNALNESDTFKETYGFEHQCRCADDWAEGNLGVVSVCYLEMCNDALDALAAARTELAARKASEAALRIQVVELGGEPVDA